jgi:GNAT superfamily N-acetyltransferase
MSIRWRVTERDDAALLAQMNQELIQDEASTNPMTLVELEVRMRGWLEGEYTAVLFEDEAQPVAYALYRDNEGRGIYLRQFFVARDRRRQGLGRRAMRLLLDEVLEPNTRVALDVLVANQRALSFWRALGFTDHALMLELTPR